MQEQFTEEVVVESSCLVSKKLLKVTQELERFVVTKFFCRDKLLQSALVRKGCASQKLIHKCVIRVRLGRHENWISYLDYDLGWQVRNNTIKLCVCDEILATANWLFTWASQRCVSEGQNLCRM